MDGYNAGKDGTEQARAVVHFRVGWRVQRKMDGPVQLGWRVQSRWDGWSSAGWMLQCRQVGCYSVGRKDGAVEDRMNG